jgi:hypothetical protein
VPDAAPPQYDGSLSVGQRIGLVETTLIRHADRIDRLEGWRDELHGAMALLKFTLGTSIVSGLIAIITLVGLIISAIENGRPV